MFRNKDDFQEIAARLSIDDKPDDAHREKLRGRMICVFENNRRSRQNQRDSAGTWQDLRRKIMISPVTKLAAAAVITTGAIIGAGHLVGRIKSDTTIDLPNQHATDTVAAKLVPLVIELPKAMFTGTPENINVPNLEKPLGRPRPPFLVPEGTENVASGKPVVSSDEEPIIGEIQMITDGDKEAADGSYVELGPFLQSVTIDLGADYDIYAVLLWHYHKQARVYFDVIVQVADDPDFIINVGTVFNNDHDNSAGLGIGKDMHYVETHEGKLIDAKGVGARYVRLYSNASSANEMNHYIEVEVFGKPARRLVPLDTKLPGPVFVGRATGCFRGRNTGKNSG